MKQITILADNSQAIRANDLASELSEVLPENCNVVVMDPENVTRFFGQVVVVFIDDKGRATDELLECLHELLAREEPEPVVIVGDGKPADAPHVAIAAGVEVVRGLPTAVAQAARRAAKHPARTKAIANAPAAEELCTRPLGDPSLVEPSGHGASNAA